MKLKHNLRQPTFRLSVSYLAVIMIMSIGFSIVFYMTSARELDKPAGPTYYQTVGARDADHEVDEWLHQRAASGRASLAMNLALLNIITFVLGGGASYVLARRTLRPIEATMRAQERFIADASHELRTPLTSLLLTSEVALRKKRITDADARKQLEQTVYDLGQLTKLSDELLDLAVVDNSIAVAEVQITEVIDAALAQVLPLATNKSILIKAEVEPQVVGTHQSRLVKLLVILLDNAIKYSPEKTTITIGCSAKDKQIQLFVKDEGSGMSRTTMEHIFDRFYREDSSRVMAGGHGLGLAIAVKLIGELGGSLSAKSSINHGSTFTITLPL